MGSTTVNYQYGLKYLLIFVLILTIFYCVFVWNWRESRQRPKGGLNSRKLAIYVATSFRYVYFWAVAIDINLLVALRATDLL